MLEIFGVPEQQADGTAKHLLFHFRAKVMVDHFNELVFGLIKVAS